MTIRNVIVAIALLAGLLFASPAAVAQDNGVADDETCEYNEAIAGICTLVRSVVLVQVLPGDGFADRFISYGGLTLGCSDDFRYRYCVEVSSTSADGITCVKYPTFKTCSADAVPDDAGPRIIVVPGNADCTIQTDGTIDCVAVTSSSVPVPVPVPSFTG